MNDEPQRSFTADVLAFLVGLLRRCAIGLTPLVITLWFDLTKYKAYGIDWEFIRYLAMGVIGREAVAFYREHKALLYIPGSIQKRLEWAEKAGAELHDAREQTANLKAVAASVVDGAIPAQLLAQVVLASPTPNPAIATSASEFPIPPPDVFKSSIPPPDSKP